MYGEVRIGSDDGDDEVVAKYTSTRVKFKWSFYFIFCSI